MIKIYILILTLFYFLSCNNIDIKSICIQWNDLDKMIRDQKISKEQAKKEIAEFHSKLLKMNKLRKNIFTFPVAKHGPESIGGKNGSGFV